VTRWSIGDLARASGLTIRTLYHYDEIGLVSASERTPSGHRRYTEDDVRLLYRVRTLRQLGFSLDDIRSMLSSSDSLHSLFTAQLAALNAQAAKLDELRTRVEGLLRHDDTESLLTTLEMMSVYESYFTADQLTSLRSRAAAMGPEAVEGLKTEWFSLAASLREHMNTGTPADDPAVQELSLKWDRLAAEFHGDDPAIKAAAAASWADNKAAISTQVGWPADDGLVDYVNRARASR
jgi:MerR family transcriptional regulator, thiopeptide resistance regulator